MNGTDVLARGADASDVSTLVRVQYSGDIGLGGDVNIGGVYEREEDTDSAYKIYADFDLSEFVPGGIIGGWYMAQEIDEDEAKSDGITRAGADSTWGIGFQMNLNDDLEFMALHSQASNEVDAINLDTDWNGTTIGLNWYPIDGMKIFGSYHITSLTSREDDIGDSTTVVDTEQDVFVIGLRRSF